MQHSRARAQRLTGRSAFILLPVLLSSCGPAHQPAGGPGQRPSSGPLVMHAGLSRVDPPLADQIVAGQTIYIPAYSSISISDHADRYDLAVTLAIRNTDLTHPIILTNVRYLAADGHVVRNDIDQPIQIAPLASAAFFVAESDSKGGVLASLLVDWVAIQPVNPPIAESAMVGVGGTQGVSFLCQGRVIADRARSIPATTKKPAGI